MGRASVSSPHGLAAGHNIENSWAAASVQHHEGDGIYRPCAELTRLLVVEDWEDVDLTVGDVDIFKVDA